MAGVTQLDLALYNADGTGTIADNRTYVDGITPDQATCILIAGTDGTNAIPLATNADGELEVNLEAADIEIGAVELKNATTDDRALIGDANTVRNATDHVLLVQAIDAAGGVLGGTAAEFDSIVALLGTIDADTSSIESAIVEDENTHSAHSMQVAGHYAAAPVELTDGDAAAILIDAFRRIQIAGYDGAQGLVLTQDSTTVSGVPVQFDAWTQLTAVGATAAVNIEGYKNFGVTIVIGSITGAYTRERVEVSRDGGTTWVNANLAQGPTGYTEYTANGNYTLEGTNRGYTHLRLYHVAEANAAVTIDAQPFCSN